MRGGGKCIQIIQFLARLFLLLSHYTTLNFDVRQFNGLLFGRPNICGSMYVSGCCFGGSCRLFDIF